ncbi:hypothetical protein [Pseudoalteromonas luteoviolacea]|uniref:Uncharacterized protein n=1 Tax=Pseudoalteromonas luteoviolacea (strain 2ta16) TaxID=1353533 RepID=V4HKY4_PSEL2|nr:hypothetical protein [Pseudoalteromonas luteoviolacea]ESP91480.1 hypothetical protein PL2TA16_00279 [Pseudoalteromonas luteoviolacea 2ta16]KZN40129.1 hypothetical protein N483_18240 [Pseudoalteromonas luteoviolacea NCIMB 1944]
MSILICLAAIWAILILRSGLAEYKYYQSVKELEPEIWAQLGAPKYFKVPVAFVSSKGVKLLQGASNKTVLALASKHRQAGIQLLSYVVLVLVACIVYFKVA